MSRNVQLCAAAWLLATPFLIVPAFAAGGGGGADPATTQCTKGKVWDKQQGKCVDPGQGYIDTDSVYETGRALAEAKRYGEAITVLSIAADRGDPRILNYLGYSHRKQGRVQVGLGYYQEALNVDPDYTLVREYMGEAYLQLGDVAAASGQLLEIEKRCGRECAEYSELSEQIAAFR
ncbi:tetratricopeptide repeat protein [Aquamicrobium sp. LC103]|uniref:tetratricopeptide repeat protein n=1 Tax=Aquamicrobium sp. LC103 TaxID=1120658 RepID=UPI00063EB5E3|nr:tetratricopeptide repeat protein [Aquamicrobium sp. LC103]TKT80386.1 tetratricopeptide repeat protein [Aquamicrobium sp. LC103]